MELTQHCMVDLETLSTYPNARILSIGACMFDVEQGIYARFYQPVKTPAPDQLMEDAEGSIFHVSNATLAWWGEQSREAQEVFWDPNAVSIEDALDSFTAWFQSQPGDPTEIRLWGNGSDFDNVILSSAYRLTHRRAPWKFYFNRCYRTVKNMHPAIKLQRLGTHHNALADAESQAKHLLKIGAYIQ